MSCCDSCERKGRMQYCTKCMSHDGVPSEYAALSLGAQKATHDMPPTGDVLKDLNCVIGAIHFSVDLMPNDCATEVLKACNRRLGEIINGLEQTVTTADPVSLPNLNLRRKSNLDLVHKMSAEELASLFKDQNVIRPWCSTSGCVRSGQYNGCKKCCIDWLNSPAEEKLN